jgi:hypothetical protein
MPKRLTIEDYRKKYVGKVVKMTSTHFNGEIGKIQSVEYPVENTPYGFAIVIELKSGVTISAHKTDDFQTL